jgi:hypothetical protein
VAYNSTDSTVSDLDELLEASRYIRRQFEPQWLVNVAYTLGRQWIKVDAAGIMYDVDVGQERVTLTDNRIRGAVHTSIAKQTKQPPAWVGVPKDPSDEEIQRARLRTIVFEHYWRELQARRKLHSALWYRETCGAGFWKLTWDDTAGEKTRVLARKEGRVLADANGRPFTAERAQELIAAGVLAEDIEERDVALGEPRLDLKTPWEMFPDALATEEGLDSCEHIGEEAVYSIEYLRRRYAKSPAIGDVQESTSPSAGVMESRFPGATSILRDSRRGAPKRQGVKVREHWSREKHCVWTSEGVVLLEEDNPYPFLPYVMFGGFAAGRFWPDAPVSDLISPQTELNKMESQIAENAERIGNPPLLESSESATGTEWQGLPGERITYHVNTGGVADIPSFMQMPEMPVYTQNRIPQILESINAISGQQEVAQGTVPEGVTAASAISMLLEANDTRLGPQIAEMGDSLVDAGRRLLWYVRAFAKTERMARIAGDESMWDIYAFQGEQLGDAGADEVEVGSSISNSHAMQQTVIRDMLNLLIQNGQVPPPRELRRLMRAQNVGGMENFFATIGRVQRFVAEENRRIMHGEPVKRNSFDDDQVHLDEHTDFQMSATYQEAIRKPGTGQMIAQLMETHVAQHREVLQQQATAQAMAQANQAALENNTPGTGPDIAAAASNGNGSVPPGPAIPST